MDTAHFEKLNRIRLEPVLLKTRTEIPIACRGGFTVFNGKPLYARPRGELNSLSYSIFDLVCVVLSTTRADAIAVLAVGECDRLVERCPARPNVTHCDVLVPD
jgi:hypothetical protein